MTINDESTIMDALANTLKGYPQYYSDTNVSIVNYNLLNAGVEHGVIITEGTIANAERAQYAYMGAGQATTYTFSLRVVCKQNRKDDTSTELRQYVRLIRTIIDERPTLDGEVISCRVASASAPNYMFRDGNGPYYRFRDLTVEVKIVEALDIAIADSISTPLAVPGD